MTSEKKKNKDKSTIVAKAVRTVLAGKRQVPAKVKTRAEVRGGGKKPWRQKGTGRARAGSNRSPIWRGGGVTFGPKGNENYKVGINKKEMRAARQEAYSGKNSITIILEKIPAKTKEAAKIFIDKKIEGKSLVVIDAKKETSTKVKKVFSNLKDTQVVYKGNENICDILAAENIVNIKVNNTTKVKK